MENILFTEESFEEITYNDVENGNLYINADGDFDRIDYSSSNENDIEMIDKKTQTIHIIHNQFYIITEIGKYIVNKISKFCKILKEELEE